MSGTDTQLPRSLRDALRGVENGWGLEMDPSHSISHITDPDPDLLFFLLTRILDWDYMAPFEKVLWSAQAEYRNRVFHLQVSKMRGLTVSSSGETEQNHVDLLSLLRKLSAATQIVSGWIEQYGKTCVEREEFFLQNPYVRVWPLHQYYRERWERALRFEDGDRTAYGKAPDPTPDDSVASGFDAVSWRIQGRMQAMYDHNFYGTPAVVFYFSFTESLFEALLAFEESRPCSLEDLREAQWKDRFKMIFPVQSDPELKQIYDELLWTKRTIRDVVVHGYAQDDSVLIKLPHFHLVPVHHRPWHEDIRRYFIPLSHELSRRAHEAIRAFDTWLENDESTWLAIRFLRTGAAIPFHHERLAELRPHMKTRERWESKMREIEEAENRMRNFEF